MNSQIILSLKERLFLLFELWRFLKFTKECNILGIQADLKEVIIRHVTETIEHCTDLNEETLPKRLCVKGCLISDFFNLLQTPNWVPK